MNPPILPNSRVQVQGSMVGCTAPRLQRDIMNPPILLLPKCPTLGLSQVISLTGFHVISSCRYSDSALPTLSENSSDPTRYKSGSWFHWKTLLTRTGISNFDFTFLIYGHFVKKVSFRFLIAPSANELHAPDV